VAVVVLFPLYWMAVSSVTPVGSLLSTHLRIVPPLNHLLLNTYPTTFRQYPVFDWLMNSSLLTVGAVTLSLAASVPAGYALSRMGSGGGTAAGMLMLLTRVLPGTLLVIPFFVMFAELSLLNTLWGLILADTSFTVPFAAWILKGFFDSVPKELEDAAMVDGCGRFATFARVIVPLAKPGIGATAIYSVIMAWSDYLFARTLLLDPTHWTITVGATSLITAAEVDWNGLMVMGVVAVIPMFIAFVVLEPFLVSGLTAGAVVG
jgi:multiple sugar transport system permease protein